MTQNEKDEFLTIGGIIIVLSICIISVFSSWKLMGYREAHYDDKAYRLCFTLISTDGKDRGYKDTELIAGCLAKYGDIHVDVEN